MGKGKRPRFIKRTVFVERPKYKVTWEGPGWYAEILASTLRPDFGQPEVHYRCLGLDCTRIARTSKVHGPPVHCRTEHEVHQIWYGDPADQWKQYQKMRDRHMDEKRTEARSRKTALVEAELAAE